MNEKIKNDYLNNNLKYLNLDDEFEYNCYACGGCCENRNSDILLNTYDIYRIAKHYNISAKDTVKLFCNMHIGHSSNIPLLTLKSTRDVLYMWDQDPETVKFYKDFKINARKNTCVFSNKNKCGIHKSKPVACALFPLGRLSDLVDGKPRIRYFVQESSCPGSNSGKKQVVRNWIENIDIEISEEILLLNTKFILNINENYDLKRFYNKLPNVKEQFYGVLVSAIYTEFTDKGKTLDLGPIEYMKKSIELTYEILDMMKLIDEKIENGREDEIDIDKLSKKMQ